MEPKALVQFNKKKYHAIKHALEQEPGLTPESVLVVMDIIQSCLNFDPNVPTCSPDQIKRMVQSHRERAQRQGVSQYHITGKVYYEKNKDKCKERVKAYRQGAKMTSQQEGAAA